MDYLFLSILVMLSLGYLYYNFFKKKGCSGGCGCSSDKNCHEKNHCDSEKQVHPIKFTPNEEP